MLIKYECRELAKLLSGREIEFDHKTYDDKEDIPYVVVNGQRLDVTCAYFSDTSGSTLVVYTTDPLCLKVVFNTFCYTTNEDDFNDILIEAHVDGLIRDMYYELNESADIGDFETDFLKNKAVYVITGYYNEYTASDCNIYTRVFHSLESAKDYMKNSILDTASKNGCDNIDDYMIDGNHFMQVTWDDGKSYHWEKIERKILLDNE